MERKRTIPRLLTAAGLLLTLTGDSAPTSSNLETIANSKPPISVEAADPIYVSISRAEAGLFPGLTLRRMCVDRGLRFGGRHRNTITVPPSQGSHIFEGLDLNRDRTQFTGWCLSEE